jgi:class 3 adenylate cyclase
VTVHTAARMMALPGPGAVLLSDSTVALLIGIKKEWVEHPHPGSTPLLCEIHPNIDN